MNNIELLNNKDFQLLISFIVALFITVTAIPVIINISRLKDLMAEIKSRSSHKNSHLRSEVSPFLQQR